MPDIQAAGTAGRIIGFLLLAQIAGGVLGNFVLSGPIFAPPGFLVNAAAHPLHVSLSVLVGLATGALSLGVAITAMLVLRRYSESMAMWLLAVAVAGFSLAAVEQIAVLSLLSLSKAYVAANGADEALFAALRGVVSASRNWAHYVHLVIGGSQLLVLFAALWRFRLVPRLLAGFGVPAAVLQITAVAMPLFGHAIVFPLLAPQGIAMFATAAWLIVRGLDDRGSRTSATADTAPA